MLRRRPLRIFAAITLLLIVICVTQPWLEVLSDVNTPTHINLPGDKRTGVNRIMKSSYDWGSAFAHFPVTSTIPVPTGQPLKQPKIQYNFPADTRHVRHGLELQRLEVKKAFQKCWKNYRKYAWMKDELAPISGTGKDTFGGFAATLIDALDSLWIMDLKDEFTEAVEAVATIDWANTTATSLNMFETTIRHLGGLLSAYDLSHEQVLLAKAVELGDMLYAGFDTPNRMPGFWIDFEKAKSGGQTADDHQPSASPCSMSLEFTRLSQLTGNAKYYDAITRVTKELEKHQNATLLPGMWPAFIDMRGLRFDQDNYFTIGALSDSLYEYLPKMHALLGNLDPVYGRLARSSLAVVDKYILFRPMLPDGADVLFAGDIRVDKEGKADMNAEGQHLSCFAGGMFALSGRLFGIPNYVDIGTKLTNGCIYAYNAFPTGIMPEYFNMLPCRSRASCEWDEGRWKEQGDAKLPKGFKDARVPTYLLRPEAIESAFVLYRVTGQTEFQDMAWKMFQAIMKATDTEFGNAAIEDVTVNSGIIKMDSMEVCCMTCSVGLCCANWS